MDGSSFSETARHTIATARGEAEALSHPYVGAEHLLLALTVCQDRALLDLWSELGVHPDDLRQELVRGLPPRRGASTGPDLPYTRTFKKVLEFAMREATAFEDTTVEPLHLLLGEAGQETEFPAKLLEGSGATLDRMRAEVARSRGRGLPERVDSIEITVRMQNGSTIQRRFEAGITDHDVHIFLAPFLHRL
jgi:ATP-dependent Clp protease ATP-binding subunit ClpA